MTKTLVRSACLLVALFLIQTRAMAQPPTPADVDTLAPFVTSTSITVFATTTATMGGNVTKDGGAPVLERGIVYSTTNTTPSIATDTKVIIGNGTGTYSQSITGLTGGTLYYVRSYATNVVGTSYGAVVTVTTNPIPPLITTSEITNITNTDATVGGNVTFSGGATVTERGVVYSSVSTTPTTADTKVQIGAGTGTYSQAITGLVLATTYYVRAYAINSAGTSYGAVFSFVPAGASVSTDAATSVTGSSVRVGGNVTNVGGSAVTDKGIVYVAGTGTPTISDIKVSMGSGLGTFSQTVSSLLPATTYSVRAYATNSATTNYGAVQTFTTLGSLSSINRIEAATTNLILTNYAISFSQAVTGVTVNNFVLSSTGGITVSQITALTGSGTNWNLSVYTGKGSGTLTLSMVNNTGILPGISNTLPFTGQTFTIDKTPPSFSPLTITSNNANTAYAKTGDIVTVNFTSSETIVSPTVNIASGTITPTNTSGNNWTAAYTLKATDAEGVVPFTVTAFDALGNGSGPVTATTDASAVTFDRTAPSPSSSNRSNPATASTNATSVQFAVTFSEAVTGVDATDFALTTTLLSGASVTSVTGSGASYIVTVNTGSGNGTIRLDLKATGTGIADLAGNAITGGFTSGQVYTMAKVLTKPTVVTNTPPAACFPATVDLTAAAVTAGSDAGLTYAYYTDAAATTTLSTPAAVAANGTYYITGTNILNITSDPVAVTVTINNFTKPVAGYTYDSYCINKPVNFTNTSTSVGTGAVSYQWSDNAGNTSTVAAPSFTYTTAGSYNVKLKVFSTSCPLVADSITKAIPVEAPTAAIRMPTLSVQTSELVTLQARGFGASYLWSPGDGLTSVVVANPQLRTDLEKQYTVRITAASGCQTVDTLLVKVFGTYVYVPSVFTPNGDNVNDVLYINLINITQLRYFRVFNRYGKKVFESTDPSKGWDGRVNGQLQPIDTYVWTFEGLHKNGYVVAQQGTVTLLR